MLGLGTAVTKPEGVFYDEITYESDFSSSVNGWSTHNAPDSVLRFGASAHGETDLLEWEWTADEIASGYIKREMDSRLSDQANTFQQASVSFDIYYENVTPDPVLPINITFTVGGFGASGSAKTVTVDSVGAWEAVNDTVTIEAVNTDFIYFGIGVASDLPTNGDKLYLKNFKFTFEDQS